MHAPPLPASELGSRLAGWWRVDEGGDRSAHCTARALLGVFWLTSYGYWAPERPD